MISAIIRRGVLDNPIGIDDSKWQEWQEKQGGGVNYARAGLKGGILFAFHKASEGLVEDPTFQSRWTRSSGLLLRGAYHFARPDVGTPEEQADFFIGLVKRYGGPAELPFVLDVEPPPGYDGKITWEWIIRFARQVHKHTSRKLLIYTSPGVWSHYVIGDPPQGWKEVIYDAAWIAHYGVDEPIVPRPFSTWLVHQYTSKGRIPGYAHNIDLNRFNGTVFDLIEFAQAHSGGIKFPPEVWLLSMTRNQLKAAGQAHKAGGGVRYVVKATALRVRSGPGVEYASLGRLRKGTVFEVFEEGFSDKPWGPWGRINWGQGGVQYGWVSLYPDFVEKV